MSSGHQAPEQNQNSTLATVLWDVGEGESRGRESCKESVFEAVYWEMMRASDKAVLVKNARNSWNEKVSQR